MPKIDNYDGKKKSHGHSHKSHSHSHDTHHAKKRRPHHEASAEEIEEQHLMEESETIHDANELNEQAADIAEETQAINTEAQNEGVKAYSQNAHFGESSETEMNSEGEHSEPAPEKIHLEFYGSEVIRQKAPKVMELADTVADEWMKDGQFEGLPVGNPIAQLAAAKVLRKAKDVEKKLEEKGVFAMAKMGLEYAKSEIEKRKKH